MNLDYIPSTDAQNNDTQIVDLILPETRADYSMQQMGQYEMILNDREKKLFRSNRRYRVFPPGTILNSSPTVDVKAIIPCSYCGGLGARGCACRGCGAPIN